MSRIHCSMRLSTPEIIMNSTELQLDVSRFSKRRQLLLDWMRSQGGGVAIIATADVQQRNRDNLHSYRFDSDFFYLTGFTEPDAWLVLVCESRDYAFLFCAEKHPDREIWDGFRWGPEAAKSAFAMDDAHDIALLDQELPPMLVGMPQLFLPITSGATSLHLKRIQGWLSEANSKARGTRQTPERLIDLAPVIAEMRLVKDLGEIDTMKRAAAISAEGHIQAMLAAAPGRREYELEAVLMHVFRAHGAQSVAYDSIVAAGKNACTLHHRAGSSLMRDKDLVLIDAGCELDGYASDITRTFPCSGRFTGPQRALYDIVLAAQAAAADCTSPSHDFNAGHEAAVRVLAQGMIDTGLLKGTLDDAIESASYQRFYMHRTGHWLGLDVHDVGSYRDPLSKSDIRPWRKLETGMVLTIEPGIYIRPGPDVPEAFWNIGIRIEDDALVTEKGCELITRDAPVDPDEIEALMRDQAFPAGMPGASGF